MNNLVKINNQQISLKEWKGQRVVTFADIVFFSWNFHKNY